MHRRRVALVASGNWTFVQRDREILETAFDVRYVPWRGKRSLPALALAVLRSDVAFAWFALDHAYVACRLGRLLRKKSVVVVGGGDAARVPELEYGVFLKPAMAARTRYALAHADRVLPVDDSLTEEIARNAGIRRPEIVTVPLGFDGDVFRPADGLRTTVLTAGLVTEANVRRKGLDTFVQVARRLPDLPFVLVGAAPSEATDRLREVAPPNVRFVPPLSPPELLREYQQARVYVQASLYEGLPSAVGEAMACGCVPVGSRVAGIPGLVDGAGFLVPPGDVEATAKAVGDAYASDLGAAARQRILDRFPMERRRQALVQIVEDLVAHRGGSD